MTTDHRHQHPETDWEAYCRRSTPKLGISVPGSGTARGFRAATVSKHAAGRKGQPRAGERRKTGRGRR
jgi:hypothetical protein